MQNAARILVTEDDEAVRTLITTLLMREGFRVESAIDGEQAIEKIATGHYDAILLDLMMPKLNGLDVISYLERIAPDVVRNCLIVITAASNKDLTELEGKPVFRLIRKPFDIGELLTAVRGCTSQRPRS